MTHALVQTNAWAVSPGMQNIKLANADASWQAPHFMCLIMQNLLHAQRNLLSLSMHEPMLSQSLSMHEPMLGLSLLALDQNRPDLACVLCLISTKLDGSIGKSFHVACRPRSLQAQSVLLAPCA